MNFVRRGLVLHKISLLVKTFDPARSAAVRSLSTDNTG